MHISFYEQVACRIGTKMKRFYWMMIDSKPVLAMLVLLFNVRTRDKVSSVQRTEAKEVRELVTVTVWRV